MKNQKTNLQIINYLNNILKKNFLINLKKPILISVSGGQDSICLLLLFLHLKNQWKFSIGLIFCNHLWQKESFYTFLILIKLGFLFEFPFYYSITTKKIFTEQKARNWRYNNFYRISFGYKYKFILTGHTASDRIETNFFQLIRGTSPQSFFYLNWKTQLLQPEKRVFITNKFSSSLAVFEFSNFINLNFYSDMFRLSKKKPKKNTFFSKITSVLPLSPFSKRTIKNKKFNLKKKKILVVLIKHLEKDLEKSVSINFSEKKTQKFNFNYSNYIIFKKITKEIIFYKNLKIKKKLKNDKNKQKKKIFVHVLSNENLFYNSFFINFCCFHYRFFFPIAPLPVLPVLPPDRKDRKDRKHKQRFSSKICLFQFTRVGRKNFHTNKKFFFCIRIKKRFQKVSFSIKEPTTSFANNFLNIKQLLFFHSIEKTNLQFLYSQKIKKVIFSSFFFAPTAGKESLLTQNLPHMFRRKTLRKGKSLLLPSVWINLRLKVLINLRLKILRNLSLKDEKTVFYRRRRINKTFIFGLKDISLSCFKHGKILLRTKQKIKHLNFPTEKIKKAELRKIVKKFFLSYYSQSLKLLFLECDKKKHFLENSILLVKTIPLKKTGFYFKWNRKLSDKKYYSLIFFYKKNFIKNVKQQNFLALLTKKNLYRNSIFFFEEKKINFLYMLQVYSLKEKFERLISFNFLKKQKRKNFLILYLYFYFQYFPKTKNFTIGNTSSFSKSIKKIFIIRPLLFLNRFDSKRLLLFWKLPLYPDKSNQKMKYYRNRIRNQFLPAIRFFFNPQIDTILFQYTEINNAEQFYFDYITTQLFLKTQHPFFKSQKQYLKKDFFFPAYQIKTENKFQTTSFFKENLFHFKNFHLSIISINKTKYYRKLLSTSLAFFLFDSLNRKLKTRKFCFCSNFKKKYFKKYKLKEKKLFSFDTQIQINISILKVLPIGIQRRVIKKFLESFFLQKIKFFHIEKIRKIISKEKRKYNDFDPRIKAIVKFPVSNKKNKKDFLYENNTSTKILTRKIRVFTKEKKLNFLSHIILKKTEILILPSFHAFFISSKKNLSLFYY